MAASFLLEIGVEEIPAGYIPAALDSLCGGMEALLQQTRLGTEQARVETMATPRRLVLRARGLRERQEDREVVSLGPAKRAAFDAEGKPTKAAIGFARSKGIDVERLEMLTQQKGEYVAARVLERGEAASAILESRLPELILSLRFPKSMRWEASGVLFARPVRWILALLDGAPLSFRIGDVASGDRTEGHRFFGRGPFKVGDPERYDSILREANVVVDQVERRRTIEAALNEAAASVGGRLVEDADLLDQVVFLVETPGVLAGGFEERHLALPREVIATAMKAHQRYFTVEDGSGRLLPNVLSVVNIPCDDPRRVDSVRKGNERVLAARLADAEFYWHEDQKTPLVDKVPGLDRVVWQESLGTLGEKVERIRGLGRFLSRALEPKAAEIVDRAALLAKADLVTEMIQDGKEFTKLQGFIGQQYALGSNEAPEVAAAIYEHYLPRFSTDALPASPAGVTLSVADKIDTIVGCFGVGLVPTGSQDPYALRRLARGVLRILREKQTALEWDLPELVAKARALYGDKLEVEAEKLDRDVIGFFKDRLENLLGEEGISYDAIESALAVSAGPRDVEARARAIDAFRQSPDFERLAIGYKRVANILKGVGPGEACRADALVEPAEKELHAGIEKAGREITPHLAAHRYRESMELLLGLRGVIDAFFDGVLVMAEDADVRANRLALLAEVRGLFLRFADLSRIVIEGEKK